MRAVGIILVAAAAQLACGGIDGPSSTETDASAYRVPIAPRVGSSWVGHALGASPGKWYDRGDLRLATPSSQPRNVVADDESPDGPVATDDNMVIADLENQRLYEVELDRQDLAKVARELEARGYAEGTPDSGGEELEHAPAPVVEPSAPRIVTKALSNGTDSRIPYGIYERGTVAEPYHKIGWLERVADQTMCTGTLIGTPETSYYVLTAAHCLFNSSGNSSTMTFVPRRDGCRQPNGAYVTPSCNSHPWGTWSVTGWSVTNYYYNNCRTLSPLPLACVADDIAVLSVSGSGEPGAMGFGAWGSTDLANFSFRYNRGYPACTSEGPYACRNYTLFGDSQSCSLGGYSSPDSDGWNRVVHHSCDQNDGMSGSPLYVYSNGAKVFGVNQGHDEQCWSPSCTNPRPNRARRITSQYYDSILWYMGL